MEVNVWLSVQKTQKPIRRNGTAPLCSGLLPFLCDMILVVLALSCASWKRVTLIILN
jgi:hypothetical protein